MARAWFHHPDISFPVLRRKASEDFIEFLGELGSVMPPRISSLAVSGCYPNRQSYYNAVCRLRKAGLIAGRKDRGLTPTLRLTPEGESKLVPALRPKAWWDEKWGGIWYMLIYDVPEENRSYRDVLRRFLQRMKMGCLQKSVWITPRDIRPDFNDLCRAAALQDYAFLFESRTVLGLPSERIVTTAWDFDRLGDLQSWYCRTCERRLKTLEDAGHSSEDLTAMAREAIWAYRNVMKDDPLLPKRLCPDAYQGRKAFQMHRKMMRRIGKLIRLVPSRPNLKK